MGSYKYKCSYIHYILITLYLYLPMNLQVRFVICGFIFSERLYLFLFKWGFRV